MTAIVARKGDMTRTSAPVIVNAGNTSLWLGTGVAGAIKTAGGYSIQDELDVIRAHSSPKRIVPAKYPDKDFRFTCDLGDVIVTHAGNMIGPKLVFHAAVMDSRGPHTGKTSSDIIYLATKNCLLLARQYAVRGIAFPVFGTGVGGMDPQESLDAILKALSRYPITDLRVRIYGYDEEMYMLIRQSIR